MEAKEFSFLDSCPKENFRCTYGACVSLSAKCDGRVDCADKSDENHPDCPVLVNQAPTTTCKLTLLRHWYLLLTECGRIRVQAEKNVKKNSGKTVFNEAPWFAAVYRKDKKDKPYVCSGTIVSPFLIVSGVLRINTDKGRSNFQVTDLRNYLNCSTEFQCTSGKCLKKFLVCDGRTDCADGSDETIELCANNTGDPINCQGQLPEGTIVRPRCAAHFETLSNYDTIECQPNGKWTNELFECIPGQGAFEGDSGGGFLYTDPVTGKYFLLGVVSNGDVRDIEKTLLTDIRKHLLWLDNWRTSVERDIKLRLK
ncbi:hypothetical protein V9T40_000423 [Parthenolecanium corni]|uniref:Sushi domain-containing protein n=1 Tax=Parthenolecanium corni TaxID=536013 RepID=A0AAN9Y0G8_9HEMI